MGAQAGLQASVASLVRQRWSSRSRRSGKLASIEERDEVEVVLVHLGGIDLRLVGEPTPELGVAPVREVMDGALEAVLHGILPSAGEVLVGAGVRRGQDLSQLLGELLEVPLVRELRCLVGLLVGVALLEGVGSAAERSVAQGVVHAVGHRLLRHGNPPSLVEVAEESRHTGLRDAVNVGVHGWPALLLDIQNDVVLGLV
mmetsp:Transcript_92467/g.214867  ORF Transcript_92467/g.214867 Transcript_92467/m.214867 type:complete len:200 (+) Transcript_92467:163-762(+)